MIVLNMNTLHPKNERGVRITSCKTDFKYGKTCRKRPLKKMTKIGFQDRLSLNQVKRIAECSEHSAIRSTYIKLPFVIKIFVWSVLEWPLKTSFT